MFNRTTIRSMTVSGVFYGLGLAAGMVLAIILINNGAIQFLNGLVNPLQLFLRLLFALFLLFVFSGISGGLGGAVGGWGLGQVTPFKDKRRLIWRSAVAFFITHALLIIPILLISFVIGFLNQNLDVQFGRLPALFTVYGLLYGAVVGLLFGWLVLGLRQSMPLILSATAGFAIGGWLVGAILYFLAQMDPPGRLVGLLSIALIMFVLGAAGGAGIALGVRNAQEGRPLLPQTRAWRIVRTVLLVIVAVIAFSALSKLIDTLTIRPGLVADTLPLETVGSHWREAAGDETAALNPGIMPPLEAEEGQRPLEVICLNGRMQLLGMSSDQASQSRLSCEGDPIAAQDSEGWWHVIWPSDQVLKVSGVPTAGHFLMETVEQEGGWSLPAIIAQSEGAVQPAVNTLADGRLLLNWSDGEQEKQLIYAPYTCDDAPLSGLTQVVYDVARQEKFRPLDDPIPYCKNRYEQLIVTPNPTNPQGDIPPTDYGAFGRVAQQVRDARYEVLFTTMQWDAPSDTVSPGDTLAEAVFDLYQKVKADPQAYPRGMTVRLMLGNLPELAIFETTNQITHMMQDLHDAGLREMVNEDIGWRLELANYAGAWPHAHSKFLVVDGKTAVAAGFNYSYLHLEKDHPSGLGLSMNDLGLQISGPVVQSVMAAYDDLWSDSDHYICSRFPPPILMLWFLWCDEQPAVASHVPEVLRFYETDGDSSAFSLHHTYRYLESDEAVLGVLQSAQESIDVYHVNFSMDTVCVVVALLSGSCPFGDLAPPYMQAMAEAAVERDIKIRALMETSAMNGLENRMAIRWLTGELEKSGKTDNVQFKFYNGKMHDKSLLVDDQFLVVGSQNFHWSAWGAPSLTEYNLATDDGEAISDYKSEFDYQWGRGIPADQQAWSN